MAHLDLGIDGLEPTPQQLSCTGLSEDIAVAPPATEEDIDAIIQKGEEETKNLNDKLQRFTESAIKSVK